MFYFVFFWLCVRCVKLTSHRVEGYGERAVFRSTLLFCYVSLDGTWRDPHITLIIIIVCPLNVLGHGQWATLVKIS